MAPFSIPAPHVVPLRTPQFGGPRTIDTLTKIDLMCDTYLDHEIYYTLDGTKPQPHAGIIQGSKLFKYKSPFFLPVGKITLKAIALSSRIHSMQSSVVTKFFEVVKAAGDTESKKNFEKVQRKKSKVSKKKKGSSDPGPSTEPNGCEENIDVVLDKSSSNGCRKMSNDDLLDFPPDLEFLPGDDISESLSEIPSLASGSNKTEELNGTHFEIQNTPLATPSPPLTESEQQTIQEKDESLSSDDFKRKSDAEEEVEVGSLKFKNVSSQIDLNGAIEVETKLLTCKVSSTTPMTGETILNSCLSCSSLNAINSQYCMYCGKKLMRKCCNCKELNSVIGIFCHYCGKKLEINNEELQISYADHCVMVEPQKKHASVQQILSVESKETQTLHLPREKNRNACVKRTPSRSPGRGYWHQQLDYICNHLKSYAYNNIEFRDSISEPILSDFQKAQVTKTDDIVSVTISFSAFVEERKNSQDTSKSFTKESS